MKFFNGLYAERTGVVFDESGYISSDKFKLLLDSVVALIDTPGQEHALYCRGREFLENHKKEASHRYPTSLKEGDAGMAKTLRFHELVRFGADIINAGLSSLPKATLVGAFLYNKTVYSA
jgi:hypothetical protein